MSSQKNKTKIKGIFEPMESVLVKYEVTKKIHRKSIAFYNVLEDGNLKCECKMKKFLSLQTCLGWCES